MDQAQLLQVLQGHLRKSMLRRETRGTKKTRRLIQKHFLTGYPHSLRKTKLIKLNFDYITKMAALKEALQKAFPIKSNISIKY